MKTTALQDTQSAANELRRCVGEYGFHGAMVHGATDGLFLDHPRFAPVFQATQDLPEPFGLMLATAAWGWHAETGLHVLRLMAAGVFDRFPDVQISLGHMGEDLPFSVARADKEKVAHGNAERLLRL